MKKLIQRTVTFIIAMAIVVPLILTCASALDDKPRTMLALGDSITTGYGLDNYVPGGNPYFCNSYGNLIASALGLESEKTYINKAVNGDTSGDLTKLLPTIQSTVQSSELIVISIGGNDLLGLVPKLAEMILGREIKDLQEAADIVPTITFDQLEDLEQNSDFIAMIASVFMNHVINMSLIAKFLETNAPDATIVFLKQYNPMNDVPGFEKFGDFADPFIDSINSTIDTMCQTYNFKALDVPAVINANAADYTNMLDFDIHPSASGHLEIAKLLASYLGISLKNSEEITTTESDVTTEPTPETTLEPEVTTAPPPETTPEPVITTETVTEPITEPVTEPITEPVTEPVVTTEPVTEPPVTTELVTEPETTPEVIVTTEPVVTTEPADTTSPETEPEVTTAPETTTSPDTSSELIIEKPGCFSAVSSAILVITSVCALIVLKKKNN